MSAIATDAKKLLLIALILFGAGIARLRLFDQCGRVHRRRVVAGSARRFATARDPRRAAGSLSDSERPKAIAVIMTATMLGYPIGPILGGWLLTHAWWGWVS